MLRLGSDKDQRKNSLSLSLNSVNAKFTYDADVAELVGAGHGTVVEHGGAGEPARVRVVGEHDQLVLRAPVLDEVEALLYVRGDDPLTQRVDVRDEVRNVLHEIKKERVKYTITRRSVY